MASTTSLDPAPGEPPPAPDAPEPAPPAKRSRFWWTPAVCVALTLVALFTATAVLGRPARPPAVAASAWFPADGHRERFARPGSANLLLTEWSRPAPLTLMQSDLMVFPYWYRRTSEDFLAATYVRDRSLLVDGQGGQLSQWDTLWTLGPDGARAGIESTLPGEAVVMVPGRLDVPNGLAAGSTWTSTGAAHRWDETAGAFVETTYRADYRAATASDLTAAGRGCLDVSMDLTIGQDATSTRRTWCTDEGLVAFTDTAGDWTPTRTPPPATLAAAPFDWSTADDLEFTPRVVNQPGAEGNVEVSAVSAPGVVQGGAILTGQLLPDVLGVNTAADPVRVVWGARPGGTPTSAATLGSVTVVTTTNRTAVAYSLAGEWLWETPLSDLSVVPPVRLGESTAVLATLDGGVVALDLATGAERWRADLDAEIRVTPIVAGDRLLIGDQGGALACLDAEGHELWVTDAGRARSIAVSAGPDPVVVFGEQGSLVLQAYALDTGRPLWRQRVYQDARQLIALDSVVVLRDDDHVLGIDPASGAVVWDWSGQRTWTAIGGGRRVLLLGDTELILLDDAGHQLRAWSHHLGDVSETVHLVAADGSVLAYGPTGLEIGSRP